MTLMCLSFMMLGLPKRLLKYLLIHPTADVILIDMDL
jgi:hypothetical protein